MSETSRYNLLDFIAKTAGLTIEDVPLDADIQKDLNVNSLKVMKVVAAVEVKYGIELDDAKVYNVRTVEDFVHLVEDTLEFGR